MFELQWLAFQADITRVVTFMLGRELNFRTYPEIGVTEGHHGVSHHGDRPEQIEKYAKVGIYQAELFARVPASASRTRRTATARCSTTRCSSTAPGSATRTLHAHSDLPLVVVAGGRQIDGGRHLVVPPSTPMTNLLLTMLDKVGVHADTLGDSSGRFELEPLAACEAQNPGRGAASRGPRSSPASLPAVAGARVARRGRQSAATRARRARSWPARCDANAAEADGTTALHWAVEHDDLELATALLAAGAKVRVANRYGVTPLHLAATAGNAALIERLLAAGADVNAALPDGETALMMAARTGRPDAVRALVAGGADVNARERWKGQTALMWAADENNADAIAVLVEAGADVRGQSTGQSAPRSCSPCAADTWRRPARCSTPAPTSRTRCPTARARWCSPSTTRTTSWPRSCSSAAPTRTRRRRAGRALHQIAWSRRSNLGFNLPGPAPTGDVDSLDLVRKLVARGADVNARHDEGAARRQPQQAEPHRRDAVPAGGEVGRRAADAAAARRWAPTRSSRPKTARRR